MKILSHGDEQFHARDELQFRASPESHRQEDFKRPLRFGHNSLAEYASADRHPYTNGKHHKLVI